MPAIRPIVAAALTLVAACAAPQSEPLVEVVADLPDVAPLRVQAASRGIPDHVELVEVASPGRDVRHFDLAWDGVPVPGLGGVLRTDRPGARMASPRFDLAAEPITSPALDEAAAIEVAQAALAGATVVSTRLVLEPVIEERLRTDVDLAGRPRTATDYEHVVRRLDLRWQIDLTLDQASWRVDVDAVTGAASAPRPRSMPAAPPATLVNATALTRFHGTRTIRVAHEPDSDYAPFQLVDAHGNEFRYAGVDEPYGSDDPHFGDGHSYLGETDTANEETAAVDAFVAVDVVWKMFHDVLGFDGPFDGPGGVIVDVHWAAVNSQWIPGPPHMQIGYANLQDPVSLKPLAVVDIVGHELGHGYFIQRTGSSEAYYGDFSQFSGLNEATGDIIGTLAEFHRGSVLPGAFPTPNWKMGDEVPGLGTLARSMISPPFPVWTTPFLAQSPHQHAGPVDRMFYILASGLPPYQPPSIFGGGAGSEFLPAGMAGVGRTKAALIWHEALRTMRAPDGYAAARELAVAAAEELHGWDAPERKAVADAFAAVNIGLPADRTAPEISDATAEQIAGAVRFEFAVANDDWMLRREPRVVIDGNVTLAARMVGEGEPPGPVRYRADVPLDRIIDRDEDGGHSAVIEAWDDWGNHAHEPIIFHADLFPPRVAVTVSGSGKLPVLDVDVQDGSTVSRVELERDGALVATDLSPPFRFSLDTSTWSDGGHHVVVAAYDRWEQRGTAQLMLTADNTAPVVTLTTAGSAPPFGVHATAIDASPLAMATFLVDGGVTAMDLTAPFQTSYTPQDASSHTLGVRVLDSFGNEGSASLAAPRDLSPPTVVLDAVQFAGAVTLSGVAADTCGLQLPMSVTVDGVVVASPSGASFTTTLPNSLFVPGTHVLALHVSDRCGNTAHRTHPFTIFINTPVVTVSTTPGSNPKRPKISATTVHDRPITRVVFRRMHATGSLELGEDTTAPYELTIDTSAWPDGLHDIEAMAVDTIGMAGFGQVGGVRADNTAPVVATFWDYGNRTFTFQAIPDDGNGSGLVGPVLMNMWLLTQPLADATAPYLYTFAIPAGVQSGSWVFMACAKDAFGNEACGYAGVSATCSRLLCRAGPGPVPFKP